MEPDPNEYIEKFEKFLNTLLREDRIAGWQKMDDVNYAVKFNKPANSIEVVINAIDNYSQQQYG